MGETRRFPAVSIYNKKIIQFKKKLLFFRLTDISIMYMACQVKTLDKYYLF